MKKITLLIYLLVSLSFSQEMFLQNTTGLLKGSQKINGQEYITVYDESSHVYRYFTQNGKEIFLIKSYNEHGDELPLSIEKNTENQNIELILNNQPIAILVNNIIYDLDGVEIGKFFRGKYSKGNLTNFWSAIDHHSGNISIYDYTNVYKIGSFFFKKEIDYYQVLGVEKIEDIDNIDPRILKKKIRNIDKYYKKIIKNYNVKKYPDDEELKVQYDKLFNAYNMIMSDLGVSKAKEKKILGFLPSEYLTEERRSKWSDDEGYVPYSRREIKQYNPASQIQRDELFKQE